MPEEDNRQFFRSPPPTQRDICQQTENSARCHGKPVLPTSDTLVKSLWQYMHPLGVIVTDGPRTITMLDDTVHDRIAQANDHLVTNPVLQCLWKPHPGRRVLCRLKKSRTS